MLPDVGCCLCLPLAVALGRVAAKPSEGAGVSYQTNARRRLRRADFAPGPSLRNAHLLYIWPRFPGPNVQQFRCGARALRIKVGGSSRANPTPRHLISGGVRRVHEHRTDNARWLAPTNHGDDRLMDLAVAIHHPVQDGVVIRVRNFDVSHRQACGASRAGIVGGLPAHLGQLRATRE